MRACLIGRSCHRGKRRKSPIWTFHFTTGAVYKTNESPHLDIRSWARQNPNLASMALQVPPVTVDFQVGQDWLNRNEENVVQEYLEYRNWTLHAQKDEIGQTFTAQETKAFAMGLLSSPLTYPMTLAYFYSKHHQLSKEMKKIHIAVVGARAEATLASEFWMEFHVAYRLFSGAMTHNESPFPCLEIDFIGPDVPKGLQGTHEECLTANDKDPKSSRNLSRTFFHGYFDEYVNKVLKVQCQNHNEELSKLPWDLVVLYNPGLGHPYLKNGWKSTIRTLVKSNLPLLLTSFSSVDSIREVEVVLPLVKQYRRHLELQAIKYQSNPWASQILTQDPLNPTEMVRPNHEVLFIPSS